MALPWIKLATDLPDHPKALELAELLDEPLAFAYLVLAWTWAARFAPDGRIAGKDPRRSFERACRWTGTPGHLAAACLEVGFLELDTEGLVLHDFRAHNGAHAEKLDRDRQRMVKRRATVARRSRDGRATEEMRGEENTPLSPPLGGGVSPSPSAAVPEKGPPPARPRRPREPHAVVEAPPGLAGVFQAFRTLVDPSTPVTASRVALVASLVAPQGPYQVEELVAAIEGAAGSTFWREKPHLLTFERVLENPARVDELRRLRGSKGWRDPRPRPAPVAPKAPEPEVIDEAARAEAEAARLALRAKFRMGAPA